MAKPRTPEKPKTALMIFIVSGITIILCLAFIRFVTPNIFGTSSSLNGINTPAANFDFATEKIEGIKAVVEPLRASSPNFYINPADPLAPAYKVGTEFYVNGAFGKAIAIANPSDTGPDSDFVTKVRADITAYLLDQGMTQSEAAYSGVFTNDDVICSVSNEATIRTFISCANTLDYVDRAVAIKPFADALSRYYTANPAADDVRDLTQTVFTSTDLQIADGIDGYRNANVGIGSVAVGSVGSVALFYGKDDSWTYYRGTQNVMACDDFNTDILMKSFAGTTCYESDGRASSV